MTKKINDILLLSTADWDNPFWTNKQHVAVELARRGHKVLYIDSLGLRSPGLNKKDLSRIFKRIGKALKPPKKVHDNIWVWSPITLPWNRFLVIRTLNKIYLNIFIKLWLGILNFNYPWLWTYNPLTTEFIGTENFSKVVYHCVDEIKAQPGMPIDILEREEKTLLKAADVIFVTAPQLMESRVQWNDNIHYFSNVADFSHFNKSLIEDYDIPDELFDLNKPILGFIGAVSGYKVDFNLLSYIAENRPNYNIVIIGLVGEGDPNTDISLLTRHSNIHLLGPKTYDSLPRYLKFFDVALLPNNLNEYTDNMFPMKFFEYLAAGKPVVSVDLPALRDFSHIAKIVNNKEGFLSAIDSILQGDVAPLKERLDVASEYTYQSRTDKMLRIISSN